MKTAGMINMRDVARLDPAEFARTLSLLETSAGVPMIFERSAFNTFTSESATDSFYFIGSPSLPPGWHAQSVKVDGEWLDGATVTTFAITDRTSDEYEAWRESVWDSMEEGLPAVTQLDMAQEAFEPFKRGRRNRPGLMYDRRVWKAGTVNLDWIAFRRGLTLPTLPAPPTLAEVATQTTTDALGDSTSATIRLSVSTGAWEAWLIAFDQFVTAMSLQSEIIAALPARFDTFHRGTQTEARDGSL